MQKIKVLIVDDHALIREGLKRLLELENDIEVIGQASNGQDGVERVLALKPDVVMLDINMPIKNGLEAVKELKTRGCPSKVIMLTIHDNREYLVEAVRTGAAGYVMKDAEIECMLEAIRSVHMGKTYIQPTITNALIKDIDDKSYCSVKNQMEKDNLTRREIEVILLIADGKNNREIADNLFISEKTVKNHVSNIFKKIDVNDRTQAAIYVFRNHMK